MAIISEVNMVDPQTDAIWILSSTFIVFTMQSGFGLLESGSVSVKNELNIMVKNAIDVVFGGLSYWLLGYGFSFGEDAYSNAFIGWGHFLVNAEEDKLGVVYSKFFFQASFATTATTIVSGAMAERTKLVSYMLFSMINTVLFSIPAHWIWSQKGWLNQVGMIDIAGAGPVHVVGGVTGLVATLILKPRHGRYTRYSSKSPAMSSPTNAVLGMFMLWWGWLGFNCGSTFGISGVKWKLAARSAASTLCASVAGGVAGFILSYIVKDRRFDVTYLINGVLGSLVSVTAVCAVVQPWEGLVIGCVGSIISNGGVELLHRLKIDDPVGCVGTHALSGSWGILAAGLFLRPDEGLNSLYLKHASAGLFYGGGFYQLGIQTLGLVAVASWTALVAFAFLKLIQATLGLRVSLEEEIIGADIIEHGIGDFVYDRKTKTLYCPANESGHSDELMQLLGMRYDDVIRLRQNIHVRRQSKNTDSMDFRLTSPDHDASTIYCNPSNENGDAIRINNIPPSAIMGIIHDPVSHVFGRHSRRRTSQEINDELLDQRRRNKRQNRLNGTEVNSETDKHSLCPCSGNCLKKLVPSCLRGGSGSKAITGNSPTSQQHTVTSIHRLLDPIHELERECCERTGRAFKRSVVSHNTEGSISAFPYLEMLTNSTMSHDSDISGYNGSQDTIHAEISENSASYSSRRADFYIDPEEQSTETITYF